MDTALQQRATNGDVEAQFELAGRLDRDGRHVDALGWLARAAERRHPRACHELGARLLVGRTAPFDPRAGKQLLSIAADGGIAAARSLLAVVAVVAGQPGAAVSMLRTAARAGDPAADAQLALIDADGGVDLEKWQRPPASRVVFEAPEIRVFDSLLPTRWCEWLIERAQPRLARARVVDPQSSARGEHALRTNSGAGFGLLESDVIVQLANLRIACAVGRPASHQEPGNVLHYQPGEQYRLHLDWIAPNAGNAAELRATGQRECTCLVYLNAGYAGGETSFPELDWRFRGRTGDALVFTNMHPDGSADRRTRHAGLPPVSGEKWLYSVWIREREYPLV